MDKREAIRKYKTLYKGLNRIILGWDPYGLFKAGEMEDEFSHEVARLLAALSHVDSESDAIDAVHKVFAESFSERDFPRAACESVGREIFAWWTSQE
jgi:Domain of unknown function (DUF1871)